MKKQSHNKGTKLLKLYLKYCIATQIVKTGFTFEQEKYTKIIDVYKIDCKKLVSTGILEFKLGPNRWL